MDEPRGARRVARYAVLVVVAVVVLTPVYVSLVGALKPGARVLDYPRSLVPDSLTLETVRRAWSSGDLDRTMLNSALVAGAITVGQLVTSVLAAYAFAFLRFPWKPFWFGLFVSTLMVPTEVTVLANHGTVSSLGWLDSYQALVVPFLATALGTFLLRQVFLALPGDLRDAAAMDGLGHGRFLLQVAVPLARPMLGALALFSFLSAWNQYLWPLLVTNDDEHRTVQLGLRSLASSNLDELNLVMAGTIIAALPIFVVLLAFQRQLVRGLTAGAVKG